MSIIFFNRNYTPLNTPEALQHAERFLEAKQMHELVPVKDYNEIQLQTWFVSCMNELYNEKLYTINAGYSFINRHTGASNAPDSIIVDSELSSWYLIEVELHTHDKEHVYDQLHTFSNIDASKIEDDLSTLVYNKIRKNRYFEEPDKTKIDLLMKSAPKVILVSNRIPSVWSNYFDEKKLKVEYISFQPYCDIHENILFRLNDRSVFSRTLDYCWCTFDPITRMLIINDYPKMLRPHNGNDVEIEFSGIISKWNVDVKIKNAYLSFTGDGMPLNELCSRYRLERKEGGFYVYQT